MSEPSIPRWSVVVPAYMPGENLGDTLQSVAEAMDGRDDFEVVVVDDASPEAITIALDAPFRVVRHDDNVGAVRNFNRAIGHASGEFIHVLHADDLVARRFYEAVEVGLSNPGVVAAATGVNRIDGEGRLIERQKVERETAGIWENAFARLAVSNRVPAASVVARRSTYDEVGFFDETLSHAADWDMWIRFCRAGDWWYDPEPLASYRVHGEQHTARVVESAKNIAEAVAVIERLPSRISAESDARLMARAYIYRAVYAGRTAIDALRSGQVRTATAQLRAGCHCVLKGVAAVVQRR